MAAKKDKRPIVEGGWQRGTKKAIAAQSPTLGKVPVQAPGPDRSEVMTRHLVWRFADADHEGPWAVAGAAEGGVLQGLLQAMGDFESMTIRELFHTGKEPGKQYDVPALPSATLARLTELEREDETKIARLRITGERRLYGFLRENVFHVLWWDPHHEVYPSFKKHT